MAIRKYFILFLLKSVVTITVDGQNSQALESIQKYALKATNFDNDNQIDSAQFYYIKLAELYFNNDQLDEYLSTFTNIADMYVSAGDFSTAIQWLDSAYVRPIAGFSNEDERLAHLEWHLFKAYAYEQLGNYIMAKSIYETARSKLVLKEDDEDFYVAKFLYQPLGNIYTRLGEYEEALNLLRKFKTISQKEDESDAIAQSINDLAIVYKILNQRELALSGYLEAIQLPNLNLITSGLIQSNLASLYFELGIAKSGLQYGNEAINSFEAHLTNDKDNKKTQQYLAWTYNLLGQIYGDLGNYTLAAEYFQQSLNMSFYAYGTKHRREIAKIYVNTGNLYLSQNYPVRALEHFQEALKCIIFDFEPDSYDVLPDTKQLHPENTIFEALGGKTMAYKISYDHDGNRQHLVHAIKNFEKIREVEALLRKSLRLESSKLLFTEESHMRSEMALEIAYLLFQENEDPEYLKEAFEIIENNKAAVLLESIKDLKNKDFANIPDWILASEQQLKSVKSLLQKEKLELNLTGIQDTVRLRHLESEIFDNNQALDNLQEQIKSEFPNYYQLKNSWQHRAGLEKIKSMVVDNATALIAYFTGDRAIYALVLTRGKNKFIKIEKEFPLEARVFELTNTLMSSNLSVSEPNQFQAQSYALYEQLIKPIPIPKPIKKLVIIADGVLGYLPFDMLVTNTDQGNYSTFDYLLKSYTISYGFSANVIYENYENSAKKSDYKPFLGIAPIFKQSKEFAYLPYSKYEVESIQQRMGGEILLSEAATKVSFKKKAADYEILHISTHAAVIDSLPLYSWITFSDHGLRKNEDHKMYLAELYALKLNAKLAVLSACETGRGEFSRGEGIMSLARGFAYTGCQSILTTLWPVNDVTTSKIMSDFYKYLADGHSKDDALRMAKLGYLENEAVDELGAHPFFWAAFIPIGNMDPVFIKHKIPTWAWISLGSLFLVLVYIFIKKKNKT